MRFSFLIAVIIALNNIPSGGQGHTGANDSEGNLYLNFRNINFVKNNEYSNPITEGYTLIGFFMQPELVYNPDEKVALHLGAHLLSYSGTNKFSKIKPVFSTTWQFSEGTSFNIGTLSGSDQHRMFDPHFNKERIYTAYSEDGLQFRTISDHIFSDTWLSWENYIFKGDNEREIFTAGESFRYISSTIAGLLRIEIPVQIQFKHYGGQISNYPEHVETYLNIAAGGKVSAAIGGSEYSSTGIECLFFAGNSMTENAPSGINRGNAGWYKLFCTFRSAGIEAGLWRSHNFYAPNGNSIFSSVSDHMDNLVISDRKLITASVSLRLPYKEFLEFYLGFDGYYDTGFKRFDNAVTLHMRFNELIKIAKIKNP
jgi:hypothetical protein